MGNEMEKSVETGTIGERLAGKYLTFVLGDEEYGLQILKVQEIIRLQEITSVPRTPDFVRGVINLRGRVVPVIELRKKFGMEAVADTDKTCIVVMQIIQDEQTVVMGIIIDEVREVRNFLAEEIEETPSFGSRVAVEFILGVAKIDNSVKMLLNIDKVLTADELSAVSSVGR